MIDKDLFSGSPGFTVIPNSTDTIPPYMTDTFQVQFCPPAAGQAVGKLSFASNDSIDSPKIVTLLGTGLALRDSLALFPNTLRFDRVLIDSCATDTVLLQSAGLDTLYLDRSIWNDPPFTLRLVPRDSTLAPGVTRKLLVTFCPTDTGEAALTQVLDERGDSIIISGRGVFRRAAAIPRINVGILCFGHSDTAFDTLSNLGNDTISVLALYGNRIPRQSIGFLLRPNEGDIIGISIRTDSLGSFTDTISIELADTTLATSLTYRVAGAALSFSLPSHPPILCVGECDTDTVRIRSAGPDTLSLSNFSITSDTPFHLLDFPQVLLPGQSDMVRLSFCPMDSLVFLDTLHFQSSDNGCDSEFSILLSGTGIIQGVQADPVDFGSAIVGECRNDSMFVANPCGPAAAIDSLRLATTDFQLLSTMPDTVPALGSLELKFRFCPTVAGAEFDTATLVLHSGQRVREPLSGVGIAQAIPKAYFTISDTSVPMGDQAVSSIRFDSSSLRGRDTIRVVVSFDPTVLSPVLSSVGSFPSSIASAGSDSVTFSDVLDFGQPGFLDAITWNTLAGPRDSSVIGLSVTADTPLMVIVNKGSVTLTDCNGLAGRLASSGSYALGPVTPNPAAGEASVTMTLGSDGYVEAAIYDMAGGLAETVLQRSFTRGSYQLTIPTDALSSGRYMLEINSMGWRAVAPIVVDR